MKRQRRSGFTLDLGDELDAQLSAFAATYYAKSKTQIVREAVIAHIEAGLADDRERRLRFMRILSGEAPPKRQSPKGRTSRTDHP